ncbi:MAG: hypothetical protein J0M24_10735 [Verrucomicrobia bacterium]|nr:hypothetical protein [Verrucomicrobiota bacterium]
MNLFLYLVALGAFSILATWLVLIFRKRLGLSTSRAQKMVVFAAAIAVIFVMDRTVAFTNKKPTRPPNAVVVLMRERFPHMKDLSDDEVTVNAGLVFLNEQKEMRAKHPDWARDFDRVMNEPYEQDVGASGFWRRLTTGKPLKTDTIKYSESGEIHFVQLGEARFVRRGGLYYIDLGKDRIKNDERVLKKVHPDDQIRVAKWLGE